MEFRKSTTLSAKIAVLLALAMPGCSDLKGVGSQGEASASSKSETTQNLQSEKANDEMPHTVLPQEDDKFIQEKWRVTHKIFDKVTGEKMSNTPYKATKPSLSKATTRSFDKCENDRHKKGGNYEANGECQETNHVNNIAAEKASCDSLAYWDSITKDWKCQTVTCYFPANTFEVGKDKCDNGIGWYDRSEHEDDVVVVGGCCEYEAQVKYYTF